MLDIILTKLIRNPRSGIKYIGCFHYGPTTFGTENQYQYLRMHREAGGGTLALRGTLKKYQRKRWG
jgi:hypothetical protein